ncbi:MAG: hypothetical protein AAFN10_06595 [Bacteroidota bacterium]
MKRNLFFLPFCVFLAACVNVPVLKEMAEDTSYQLLLLDQYVLKIASSDLYTEVQLFQRSNQEFVDKLSIPAGEILLYPSTNERKDITIEYIISKELSDEGKEYFAEMEDAIILIGSLDVEILQSQAENTTHSFFGFDEIKFQKQEVQILNEGNTLGGFPALNALKLFNLIFYKGKVMTLTYDAESKTLFANGFKRTDEAPYTLLDALTALGF